MSRMELVRAVHSKGTADAVYANAIGQNVGKLIRGVDAVQLGMDYVGDVIDRMGPRDPAEEILVAQLVLAHARVLHLTHLANQQQSLEGVRILNEYADRASNTSRRLVLALADYRRPPRSGDSFTAIKQANIAGQQVIQNNENSQGTKPTNEQGCGHSASAAPATPTTSAALPADGGGVDRSAALCRPRKAVGAVHGPANASGEVPLSAQRSAAWGAVG